MADNNIQYKYIFSILTSAIRSSDRRHCLFEHIAVLHYHGRDPQWTIRIIRTCSADPNSHTCLSFPSCLHFLIALFLYISYMKCHFDATAPRMKDINLLLGVKKKKKLGEEINELLANCGWLVALYVSASYTHDREWVFILKLIVCALQENDRWHWSLLQRTHTHARIHTNYSQCPPM